MPGPLMWSPVTITVRVAFHRKVKDCSLQGIPLRVSEIAALWLSIIIAGLVDKLLENRMRTLGSVSRGALRRLTSWPLKLVSENLRAEALEGLSEKMIASMPVTGGCIRFYAPSSLLRSRAGSMFSKEPETIQWIDGFED